MMGSHEKSSNYFRMPLHYPKYTKEEYQEMPEWMVDRLLAEYGLPSSGDVAQKRRFAMGAFLWPDSSTNNKFNSKFSSQYKYCSSITSVETANFLKKKNE